MGGWGGREGRKEKGTVHGRHECNVIVMREAGGGGGFICV